MRKIMFFKKLVDILYYLHFLGLLAIIFILPFGIANINQIDVSVENWTFLYWGIPILSLIAYIIFLRGLYYLRKVARFLLANNYFSDIIINNLRRSGNHFLLTGILLLSLIVIVGLNKLFNGRLELTYDTNLIIPLFIMIIGLFFIIQSKTLFLAKNFKEENELTV